MVLRLPASRIIELVRKNLDEVACHETQMIGAETDNQLDIAIIVIDSIPEAIRRIHLEADAALLEGKEATEEEYVVENNLIKMKVPVLRLVSFKAKESPYVVNETFAEGSPIGRMQLDKYVRGTFDSPVMVEKNIGNGINMPTYAYYSFKDDTDTVEHISYIPYPEEGALYYEIAPRLLDALIAALTSMAQNIYGIHA